jgi:hypothetical protein
MALRIWNNIRPEGPRGVDALVEHQQVDAPGLKLVGKSDQMLERAPEAVQLGDDQLVALPGHEQGLVQLRPPGQLVDEDFVAARVPEGVSLGVGVLVDCPDLSVALAECSANRGWRYIDPYTGSVTRLTWETPRRAAASANDPLRPRPATTHEGNEFVCPLVGRPTIPQP